MVHQLLLNMFFAKLFVIVGLLLSLFSVTCYLKINNFKKKGLKPKKNIISFILFSSYFFVEFLEIFRFIHLGFFKDSLLLFAIFLLTFDAYHSQKKL